MESGLGSIESGLGVWSPDLDIESGLGVQSTDLECRVPVSSSDLGVWSEKLMCRVRILCSKYLCLDSGVCVKSSHM